ncbi:transcriptional protein SWT1 [Corythoichthys intestinalis]|uniref:transcriptional protein SWT1 n=1 Tax=Corythoichthys intestinalis TaxID=161448 RepID=UPI0025A67D21|nr:transcriptional protein SWT1 [Corythoichthys intestinalis]
MSERSRKRKHKRSSKEEETSTNQLTSDRSKRRHNDSHSSHSKQHREHGSHMEKESRRIKKAEYKHSTREHTDKRRRVSQTDAADSKTNIASASTHNITLLKMQHRFVGKDDVASRSKIKETRTSRSQSILKSDTDHRRKEKHSKYSSDKKSHHVGEPNFKKRCPSYGTEERRNTFRDLLKSKCKDVEIQKAQNESKTEENKKETQTSIIKATSRESQELLVEEKEILDTKPSTDSTEQQFSISTKPKMSSKIAKSLDAIPKISPTTPVHFNFKIPKKVKPGFAKTNTSERSDVTKTSKTGTCTTEHAVLKASANSVDVSPSSLKSFERKDESPSSSIVPPSTCDVIAEETIEQMQVAEELHLARTEKRLEVDIMQSYGELTCMDIDPPEESRTNTLCKQPANQDVILVLDTNILLSHLDYVKNMPKRGLGAFGIPIVLIPWVVLQELDSLKKGKGLKDCVAHLACPAISYIYNSLKLRERHLWGQSMQQAAEINNSLIAENNDDKVLQCCLQYQNLYPGCAVILCTNDKNLCSKAVLSGVKALSKTDLEAEVEQSQQSLNNLQSTILQRLPQIDLPMSAPIPERGCTQAPSFTKECLSLCLPEEERKSPAVEDEEKINRCIPEFEECLQEVLSNVLEMEMKAVYNELWKEIIYRTPPWNLLDILQCLKKHWIAVFGFIVPRSMLQTVLNLINFFQQGHSRDLRSTLVTLQEAKEFVKAFRQRSSLVPKALTAMDNIVQKLKTKHESDDCDVVMNEENEAKHTPTAHVHHHEVWAMFENIWCKVCEISLEVFKALAFDPHTRQSALPVGGPAPPQDAVVCLSQISSTVSQLLQAFISVLSSPGLQEVQLLLSMIRSNKMVDVNSRLVDTDLLNCFSQQDYREKLRVGVNQLKELKDVLDHCVQAMGLHASLNM